MHICQIEIDNFKSFKDKTVLTFRKGFTTIAGPNGSGKSNIVDSVLFCLGLSTSRTMRAEKLGDLINNLSPRRQATVRIIFQKDDADQGRDASQLELVAAENMPEKKPARDPETGEEIFPEEEYIVVSRRIKAGTSKDSPFTSTYTLNGKTTTLTEIHDTLARFHVSPGSFNVIMQNDVTGFVHLPAVERRRIIDEIAGVAEFDRKIDQAQNELTATATNIERNGILLAEIEMRIVQLATEREQALKYQKLRDDRQGWETKLLAAKYFDLKKALHLTNQNITQAKQDKQTLQTALTAMAKEIAGTRGRLLDLNEEVKRKGEDQQIALQKQIESFKGHVFRKEESIKMLDQQIEGYATSKTRMEEEMVRVQEKIAEIDSELDALAYQQKELEGLYGDEEKAFNKLNKKFEQLTEATGELSGKRSEIRDRQMKAEDVLGGLKSKRVALEGEKQRLELEITYQTRGADEFKEKHQTLVLDKQKLENEIRTLDLEKKAFEAQLKDKQLEFSQLRVASNNAQAKLNELQQEYTRLESRKQAYADMNFAAPVEMILNSGMKGIHGTLAQLGQVEGDYATAMEIALGNRVQHVVVDTDKIGQEGIEFLKKNKAGRATFLPLNKLDKARSLPSLPDVKGVVDFARNLISYDGKYEDVFAMALTDTLVMEDLESARKLIGKYRMVTLDGSLLERSGAMTGGAFAGNRKGGGFFADTRKLDDAINETLDKRDKAEIEKEKVQKHLTSSELALEKLKEEYGGCLTKHQRVTMNLENVTSQLADLKAANPPSDDAKDQEKELAAKSTALEKLQAEITKAEKQLQSVQDELEAIDSKLPSDQINELRKELQDVQFQMNHFATQVSNIKVDLQAKQTNRDFQVTAIDSYKKQIEDGKGDVLKWEKEKLEHLEEIRLTQIQIADLDKEAGKINAELKQLQEKRDEIQQELIDQEKAKGLKERDLTQIDEQVVAFQTRKRELEPMVEEAHEAFKDTMIATGIDPDSVKEEELPSEEEVTKNIQSLTRRMEALEPVNMLSIQEYDDVNERKTELFDKNETLNRERDSLLIRISGYEDLKRVSFMKAFETVDGNFKEIFQELSDDDGRLVLNNPEEPFAGGMTIEVQRGKRKCRLEALSGGERSLTTLAFVFALQRTMPAPFYALDEVDQNLDGINAEKLANMVHRESGKGRQFIVVSHRKPMLLLSDQTLGVTHRHTGETLVVGANLNDGDDFLEDIMKEEETKQQESQQGNGRRKAAS